MSWIGDLLALNAKVFNLLSDVDRLNKRLENVDQDVRDMGREIAQLKGYLAGQINPMENSDELNARLDVLAKSVESLSVRLIPDLADKDDETSTD